MAKYQFRIATPDDDLGLRELLAATPMDGRIAVRFAREPSFLDAVAVEGPLVQVAVCEDAESGLIVGCGTRSVRDRFIQGKVHPVGYLGDLRGAPQVRRRALLGGAFRFLHGLHGDGRAPFYLTTIAEGNEVAVKMLTSGRGGLPIYRPLGAYHTLAIPLGRTSGVAPASSSGVEIRAARTEDLLDMVAFLNRVGASTSCFPVYGAEDFFRDGGTFRDLRPEDLLLAYRGGRIVGTLGGWDQHSFKQTVVVNYSGAIRWIRPAYNLVARFRNRPGLPAPGAPFRYVTAALPLVEDDDPAIFRALLDHLCAAWCGRGRDYLLVGLHAAHPFVPVVARRATTRYITHLYGVYWGDGPPELAECEQTAPYLELGCL